MRKLGIVIAITAAATLGFAGNAFADGHEETLCPVVDEVTGQVLNPDAVPLDDTQQGLVDTCTGSSTTNGLAPSPLLCGLQKDVEEVIAPELGAVVDGVHGGINTLETEVLSNVPVNLLTVNYPCGGGDGPVTPNANKPAGGGGAAPQVLGANAAADGSLPRTGGELFAGAGFALMSLGALVRRFLP